MRDLREYIEKSGDSPFASYLSALVRNGRHGEAASINHTIRLLARFGESLAQELPRTVSRIDAENRIYELRSGAHRVAYARVNDHFVLLHAWRKQSAKLDARALARAQRNLQDYLDRL